MRLNRKCPLGIIQTLIFHILDVQNVIDDSAVIFILRRRPVQTIVTFAQQTFIEKTFVKTLLIRFVIFENL